ncbi:hypothetical protein K1719_039039 [Acacia pycnantha]|nr:hypothetical protein K1719_039039 [Acacia pycnantha]
MFAEGLKTYRQLINAKEQGGPKWFKPTCHQQPGAPSPCRGATVEGSTGCEGEQGGKYVGFGSSPAPPRVNNQQNDVLSVMSQGFGKLSLVVASTAQSAANVVGGTKEITTKKMIFIKYS